MITPIIIQDIDAYEFETQPNLLWKLGTLFEDARQSVINMVDPVAAAKEKILDASRIQHQIFVLNEQGIKIPQAYEDRRMQKLDEAEGVSGKLGYEHAILKLREIGEYNQIRILYSQFPDVANSLDSDRKDEFNRQVNALITWQTNCSGTFEVRDYRANDNSLEQLIKKCPALENHTIKNLRLAVAGTA